MIGLFQSTHLREVRPSSEAPLTSIGLFQSTHLREVRLVTIVMHTGYLYFNPRTYVRCDVAKELLQIITLIYFNPRTYVRCDLNFLVVALKLLTFQSTHLREVRQ